MTKFFGFVRIKNRNLSDLDLFLFSLFHSTNSTAIVIIYVYQMLCVVACNHLFVFSHDAQFLFFFFSLLFFWDFLFIFLWNFPISHYRSKIHGIFIRKSNKKTKINIHRIDYYNMTCVYRGGNKWKRQREKSFSRGKHLNISMYLNHGVTVGLLRNRYAIFNM